MAITDVPRTHKHKHEHEVWHGGNREKLCLTHTDQRASRYWTLCNVLYIACVYHLQWRSSLKDNKDLATLLDALSQHIPLKTRKDTWEELKQSYHFSGSTSVGRNKKLEKAYSL